MFLPINGRVAIIDNNIDEAKPLFQIFRKNRIPYIFFDASESEFLPDESDETNDIRLLFVDLNLIDKSTRNEKQVKSELYGIIKRIISPNNFPYSIIVWSTQENTYLKVLEDLFQKEFSDRKPIEIVPFNKSDYIDATGENIIVKDGDEKLIANIKDIIKKNQAYSTLVYWENKVHKSADYTLQSIFSNYSDEEWHNKTNFIIDKLSQAYLGFKNHKQSNYIQRTKGALQAFNNIFYDTLESQINILSNIHDQDLLKYDESTINKSTIIDLLNYKLIASETEMEEIDYTGMVIEDSNSKSDPIFNNILNESVDRFEFKNEIDNFQVLDEKQQNKEIDKKYKSMRSLNRESWKKVYVVVTPLCDKVQNKYVKIRVVKGIIIESKFKKYLDKKTEALYISPSFNFDDTSDKSYNLIINYRYFFTYPNDKKLVNSIKQIKPIFRLRSSIIAEIQSKLARHINRQGILYVE